MLIHQPAYEPLRHLIDQHIAVTVLKNRRVPVLLRNHIDGIELLSQEISHDVAEGIPVDDDISGISARILVREDSVYIIGKHLHSLYGISFELIIRVVKEVAGS